MSYLLLTLTFSRKCDMKQLQYISIKQYVPPSNINIVFLTYNKYMFSKLHVNQYKAHSVLLKLLCFNFKLFTQRSRMLRLNWMHFLHFCKQKYRIKLLHCAGYYQNEKVMREIEVPTANMFSLHHLQYSPETFCNYHVACIQ